MNEKQPYEKHLAEKLQQLPPPGDANRSWPQMRSLLDNELPEGGGSGFGRNGATKWWMIGLLVGVITIGTWLSTKQSGPNEKDAPTASGQIASEKETTPSSGVSLPASNEKNNLTASSSVNDSKAAPSSSVKEQPPQNSLLTDNKQSSTDNSSNTTLPTVKETEIAKKNEGSEVTKTNKDNTNTTKLNSSKNNPAVEAGSSAAIVKSNSTLNNNTKSNQPGSGAKQNDKTVAGLSNQPTGRKNAVTESNQVNEDFLATYSGLIFGVDKSTSTIGETDALIKGSPDAQSIASVVPKAPPKPGRRYNKYTKSFEPRSNKPRVVGTGDEKNMAFGLSLPLGFPVGDQQAVAYNFNAGQNTISDYLPAPHFQYHLNEKSFLQSELQFVAPQFIQPVLLSQNIQVSSMQTKYTSIYAKKLYYFNMPFTAYYSPFKHFYLGTGFQFSSMLSGVAMNEEKLYTVSDSSITTNYTKFRNDSLSNKFDGSEFRILFDANYYWQKFNVGLRYNQALTNYISIRATPTSGLFQDRNKAIQFYLRYNFWEDKKKKKTNTLAIK